MRYISKDGDAINFDAYLEYLADMKDRLPLGVRGFLSYEGRFRLDDRQCLHDSWIETFNLIEKGAGSRLQVRDVQIEVLALGAYHDGYHRITYFNVSSYSMSLPSAKRGENSIGHGDWLIDEILLTDDGMVIHEVEFSDSGSWRICCSDIEYEWIPFHSTN